MHFLSIGIMIVAWYEGRTDPAPVQIQSSFHQHVFVIYSVSCSRLGSRSHAHAQSENVTAGGKSFLLCETNFYLKINKWWRKGWSEFVLRVKCPRHVAKRRTKRRTGVRFILIQSRKTIIPTFWRPSRANAMREIQSSYWNLQGPSRRYTTSDQCWKLHHKIKGKHQSKSYFFKPFLLMVVTRVMADKLFQRLNWDRNLLEGQNSLLCIWLCWSLTRVRCDVNLARAKVTLSLSARQ